MKFLARWCIVLLSFSSQSIAGEAPGDHAGIPITVVEVQQGDIQDTTHVQALVESLSAPVISAKVSAEVIGLYADEGDPVHKGDLLAKLDDEGFRLDREAAQADIARLEVTLANQRLTLKRDEQLFEKGLIPDTRLDASKTTVKQTRASIVHAKALLKKAEYQLSHATVRSPIDGVIQQRLASVGDYLNPMSPSSKPLFQIVDVKHLRVRLFFPDRLAGRVHIGSRVILKQGDQLIETRIRQVRPMIDESSRSFLALADVENRYHWPPGIWIGADVILEEHPDAVLVPEGVLVRRPSGLLVYRLKGDAVEGVRVETGIRQMGRVEILSGVRAGDRLALDGAAYLTDGVAVRVSDDSGVPDK